MYIDHRQSNWSEWLAIVEFAFNNKVYTATKVLLFQVNYRREPRMGFDIRKKRKNVKVKEFAREIKEKNEKARSALVKSQEEMKRQVDRTEEYRVGDKVLISTKDFLMELMKRVIKKLIEKYIGLYMVKKIMLENAVELELLVLLKIHLVLNVKRIVKNREQVEGQNKIPLPPIKVASKKEYEVEKILD